MKAGVSENARGHRRQCSLMPVPQGELRRDISSDLQSEDKGIQSERRLECLTDSGLPYRAVHFIIQAHSLFLLHYLIDPGDGFFHQQIQEQILFLDRSNYLRLTFDAA